MSRFGETIRCDGCGVEIELSPVKVGDFEYCCLNCSQGLACRCGERLEFDDQDIQPIKKEEFSDYLTGS